MKRKMKHTQHRERQQGFVSIIVAATVMILLSLITIGFTRVMQREQREALDRQLTRQATYAAESGVNIVWQYIQDEAVDEEKELCGQNGEPFRLDTGGANYIEVNGQRAIPYFDTDDDTAAIQITCVLYDKNPPEIRNQVRNNEEAIFPFEEKDGDLFGTITLRWEGDATPAYPAGCNNVDTFDFPETYSGIPILKLDLYNTMSFTRNDLANRVSYLYLIPCDVGVNSMLLTGQREIYKQNVQCDSGVCSITLDVSGMNSNRFFVRHKLLYGSGEVIIGGADQSGVVAEFSRAQSVIDVTARATDVVRRLRVHVPYSEVENIPGAVVTVGSGNSGGSPNNALCKEIYIVDSGTRQSIRNACDD